MLTLGLAFTAAATGCSSSSPATSPTATPSSAIPTATSNPPSSAGPLLRGKLTEGAYLRARAKLLSLPAVVSVRYAEATGEMLVQLSRHVTRSEEQRVVLFIARATNQPGAR